MRFYIRLEQRNDEFWIIIRYLSGIVPKMRVKFGSRIFDILSVINVKESNRELQLMCRESIGRS